MCFKQTNGLDQVWGGMLKDISCKHLCIYVFKKYKCIHAMLLETGFGVNFRG